MHGDNFNPQPYGIGLRNGDHEFRDWINDVIEEIVADGRYEQAWLATAGQFDARPVDLPVVDRY